MKKLTNIPYKIWVAFTLFVLSAVIFLAICFSYELESTIKTSIQVAGWNNNTFLISSKDIYKIRKENLISVMINKKTYSGMITDIEYDEESKCFKMKVSDLGIDLIPNTTLPATIIYGKHKVFDEIFGSV